MTIATATKTTQGERLTREDVDRAIRSVGRAKDVADIYPVSPLQQGLLFHSFFSPHTAVYVSAFSWRITGPLNVDAMERAWNHVVERHDILRTAFVGLELPTPLQVVMRRANVPFRRLDWRELASVEQDKRYLAIFEAERLQPFDFTKPPMMRITLVRIADDVYRLLWTIHLVTFDGWSIPTLMSEALMAYEAYRGGGVPQFKPPQQYREFIAWLRRQDPQATEQYWRKALEGFSIPTLLSLEERAPESSGDSCSEYWHEVRLDLEGIKTFARQHRVTINSLVQGAWALLLSRHTGEKDIVFGVTLAGRPTDLPGIETAIGPYINTLPFRVQVDDEQSVAAWLQGVHRRQVELLNVQHSALAQVQRWSDVPVGLPLFESSLVFENYPTGNTVLAGSAQQPSITVQTEQLVERSSIPLSISFVAGRALGMRMTFDQTRFARSTIVRVARHFETVLTAMIADPLRKLGTLPLLSAAERDKLLSEWNDNRAEFPLHERIEGAFCRRAAEQPTASALIHRQRSITYAQLNAQANQVAHYLIGLGVTRGTIVGLCIERSPELIIGLLGILKSGAAYLPIDPTYPKERLHYMIEECEPPVLLTRSSLTQQVLQSGAVTVCIDEHWPLIAQHPTSDPRLPERATDGPELAYVVYTSGSSGRPKGVMGAHRGVLNYLSFISRRFDLSANDIALNISSISFDASIRDIFGALSVGATLVIPEHERAREAGYLAELIERERVSVLLSIVPSLLDELSRAAAAIEDRRHSPRLILVSGQALYWDSRQLLTQAYGSHARLVNQYGPTETTMTTTVHPVPEDGAPGQPIQIGRPIANARMYVLDGQMRPVPMGAPGELYIGGAGVTLGYMKQADLTAERFVVNPFDQTEKLYRTGDRVRYHDDGVLQYLGRTDNQVKIRGFRIEPGEIEASLLEHAHVDQAVVMARQFGTAEPRLAAYVTHGSHPAPTASELRDHLRSRIPDYMLPAAFVSLARMPLTPNGKIDRRALPAPDVAAQLQQQYAAPRNEVEQGLAEIWARALKLERIGIHDSFFDAGGDSIIALQVTARAAQANLRITLRDLFEHQTIARLATTIVESSVADLPLAGSVLPCTPLQRELLLQLAQGSNHDMRALLLHVRDRVAPALLSEALRAVASQHDALRLRFTTTDDGCLQRFLPAHDATVPFEHVDLSTHELPARQAQMSALTEALFRRANSDAQSLLSVALIDLGIEGQRVLVAAHRLIMDGRSWQIFVDDLLDACAQLRSGPSVRLPKRTGSYLQWAQRIAGYIRLPSLLAHAQYWKDLSWGRAGALPKDLPGNEVLPSSSTVAAASVALDAKTTQAIQQLSADGEISIKTILLTGVFDALRQWSGHAAFVFEIEDHDRSRFFADLDLTRTIGCFAMRFPLLIDAHNATDLPTTLRTIQRTLNNVPFGGLGYGVVRCIDASQLSTLPTPQVGFCYLGEVDQVAASPFFTVDDETRSENSTAAGAPRLALRIEATIVASRLSITLSFDSGRFAHASVESLGRRIEDSLAALASQAVSDSVLAANDEPGAPLTPIQRMCIQDLGADLPRAIPIVTTQLQQELLPQLLEQALHHVVAHHDATRMQLSESDGLLAQRAIEPELIGNRKLLTQIDALDADAQQRRAKIEAGLSTVMHSIDLKTAPLLRAALIRTRAREPQTLIMAAHHFAVDPVSWGILHQDLRLAYEQLRCNEPVRLPRMTTSFDTWARRLGAHANSPALLDDLAYWTSLPWESCAPLPTDRSSAHEAQAQLIEHVSVSLDERQTQMLQQRAQREFGAQLDELLLGALVIALGTWTGHTRFAVDVMDHGRRTDHFPDVDLSRTAGWFSTRIPVLLEVCDVADVPGSVRSAREQIHTARRHAIGFGALRYAQDGIYLNSIPTPQVRFNLVGQMDARHFDKNAENQFDGESFLGAIDSVRLNALLNVLGYLESGRLHVHFRYDGNVHDRKSIETAALSFETALRTMMTPTA